MISQVEIKDLYNCIDISLYYHIFLVFQYLFALTLFTSKWFQTGIKLLHQFNEITRIDQPDLVVRGAQTKFTMVVIAVK